MKKVHISVNGVRHELIAHPKTVLLDLLREDLRLTGAKQSCIDADNLVHRDLGTLTSGACAFPPTPSLPRRRSSGQSRSWP